MEGTGCMDAVDGDKAKGNNMDGTANQPTEEGLAGTVTEAPSATGSESAPPCKTPLICSADGLDHDTFKACKELFRPFKKSLRKLNLPQDLPTKKKLKYMKEALSVIGERIDLFLQQYCKASEVKLWQKILWQFISLFSEMDADVLQKLHEYIKNNQMDHFQQLCCPLENPNPVLEEEKMKQLYRSWGLCKSTTDLQEHPGQEDYHQQHNPKVTTQQED